MPLLLSSKPCKKQEDQESQGRPVPETTFGVGPSALSFAACHWPTLHSSAARSMAHALLRKGSVHCLLSKGFPADVVEPSWLPYCFLHGFERAGWHLQMACSFHWPTACPAFTSPLLLSKGFPAGSFGHRAGQKNYVPELKERYAFASLGQHFLKHPEPTKYLSSWGTPST